jgi:hypothetical protein
MGGGQCWLKFRVVVPRARMTASSASCSLPPINRCNTLKFHHQINISNKVF